MPYSHRPQNFTHARARACSRSVAGENMKIKRVERSVNETDLREIISVLFAFSSFFQIKKRYFFPLLYFQHSPQVSFVFFYYGEQTFGERERVGEREREKREIGEVCVNIKKPTLPKTILPFFFIISIFLPSFEREGSISFLFTHNRLSHSSLSILSRIRRCY